MNDIDRYRAISPTTLADVLPHRQMLDHGIRPLWDGVGRIVGPAYPVYCAPGDNLMVHTAIYRAEPGDVICVEAGTLKYAVAGGNVCAIAHRRGIAGFVVDGVIRDLVEVRASGFPVFARGVVPKPGEKDIVFPFDTPITCGGVRISAGDVIVGDDDGLVVIPSAQAKAVLEKAEVLAEREVAMALDAWEADHRAKIAKIYAEKGLPEPF